MKGWVYMGYIAFLVPFFMFYLTLLHINDFIEKYIHLVHAQLSYFLETTRIKVSYLGGGALCKC